MNLATLLDGSSSPPNPELGLLPISGLTLDSRQVRVGNVFFALQGQQQHGLAHAAQALAQGAAAIVYQPSAEGLALAEALADAPLLALPGLADKLGALAAKFYGDPSSQLAVIGITGTNGKTSCSQFLAQTVDSCGLIGTLGWGEFGRLQPTTHTTPDVLALQFMLAQLRDSGKHAVAMEASSHGLAQGRLNAVRFTGAVFTNLTRDHLDYHGTMDAYLAAKSQLFRQPGLKFVVVNLDADGSGQMLASVPPGAMVWGVSRQGKTVAQGETLLAGPSHAYAKGLEFRVTWRAARQMVTVPLYGDFNVENVLLVLAVLLALGEEFVTATEKLRHLRPVNGRMQHFGGGAEPLVFVDYAHTPDALAKVLYSARQHCRQQLGVVFGCGGDRDQGKRPLMGEAASRGADWVIVTDDNPRSEEPASIVNQILGGCDTSKTEAIADRAQAIRLAVLRAAPGDCLVVAGKGHENYQEIQGVRLPFSDQQVVCDALAARKKS